MSDQGNRHMEAAKFLSEISAYKGTVERLQARVEGLEMVRRSAQEYMDRHGKPYETAARRMLRKDLAALKEQAST